jgi:hypothetical protein
MNRNKFDEITFTDKLLSDLDIKYDSKNSGIHLVI